MAKKPIPFKVIKGNIYSVPLWDIRPNPYQVRVGLDDDYVASLAESIRENEMVQIPQGTLLPNGKVQLIFGHNRLAAHKLLAGKDARYKFMPVEIVAEVANETMFTRAIAENVHGALESLRPNSHHRNGEKIQLHERGNRGETVEHVRRCSPRVVAPEKPIS